MILILVFVLTTLVVCTIRGGIVEGDGLRGFMIGLVAGIIAGIFGLIISSAFGDDLHHGEVREYQLVHPAFISYSGETVYHFPVIPKGNPESQMMLDVSGSSIRIVESKRNIIEERCKIYDSAWYALKLHPDDCTIVAFVEKDKIEG